MVVDVVDVIAVVAGTVMLLTTVGCVALGSVNDTVVSVAGAGCWVALLVVCTGVCAGAFSFRVPDDVGLRTVGSVGVSDVVDVFLRPGDAVVVDGAAVDVLVDVALADDGLAEDALADVLAEAVLADDALADDVLADDVLAADELADDDPLDPDPDCPDVSAHAIPQPQTNPAPTPSAAANPPIRPMYPAAPMRI